MKKLRNMINQINEYITKNDIYQEEIHDDIFYQFEELCLDNIDVKIVQESSIDAHRWYGVQEIVFEIKYKNEVIYISNKLVTQIYSEMENLRDICWKLKEFEIVQPVEETIKVIRYKVIQ